MHWSCARPAGQSEGSKLPLCRADASCADTGAKNALAFGVALDAPLPNRGRWVCGR